MMVSSDSPDCPGGGMPPVPLGNRTKMESTAALLPKQGSRAMGFGTDCKTENIQLVTGGQILANTRLFSDMDKRGFAATVFV